METIKPQQNQNIFDIALQAYGTIEMTFDLLEDNDMTEVTETISVYDDIKILREPIQRDIATFYQSRGLYPATDAKEEALKVLKL